LLQFGKYGKKEITEFSLTKNARLCVFGQNKDFFLFVVEGEICSILSQLPWLVA